MKTKTVFAITAAALFVTASAITGYVKVFSETYGVKTGSTLATTKCAICHVGKTKKLNPFGQDVDKARAGAKKMTPEILHKTDDMDSDKDGVKNIDEINADKLPGDATSKPGTN